MVKDRVLLVLLDGFKKKYLSEKHTPFLWRLATDKNAYLGEVEEPFGFQTRPAFISGIYPKESGIGHMFYFNPNESLFWWMKYLPRESWMNGKLRSLFRRIASCR